MNPFYLLNISADAVTSSAAMAALLVVVIWTAIWKGIALWRSARNSQKIWFIVMLVINTVGILEIIYIVFFSKPKKNETDNSLPSA